MSETFILGFEIVSVLFALFDFFYAYKSYRQAEEMGRFLGASAFSAGVIVICYLFSIRPGTYLSASVAASLYFSGIDWMLVSLTHFIFLYTGRNKTKLSIYARRMRAIQGMNFRKALKASSMKCTQTHPISGIANWKKAYMPAIMIRLGTGISGSLRPFATQTEKASIARPAPSPMLFMRKNRSRTAIFYAYLIILYYFCLPGDIIEKKPIGKEQR